MFLCIYVCLYGPPNIFIAKTSDISVSVLNLLLLNLILPLIKQPLLIWLIYYTTMFRQSLPAQLQGGAYFPKKRQKDRLHECYISHISSITNKSIAPIDQISSKTCQEGVDAWTSASSAPSCIYCGAQRRKCRRRCATTRRQPPP